MRKTFFCIDAHTCGNPVRVVAGGGPPLDGATMSEKRQDFIARYDWIRTGLMFEPRGHDVMSGTILYEPMRDDTDCALLFIETSGCLPMCGHGAIGTVTVLIEEGLVTPKVGGQARLRGAGRGHRGRVFPRQFRQCRRGAGSGTSRPSSTGRGLEVDVPDLGRVVFDVAYGGNFYAIIEPQATYRGLDDISALDIQRLSPVIRRLINEKYDFVHPENPTITGLRHVLWAGKAHHPEAMRGTPCSTARRRSTARPAAPARRAGWRSSPPAASSRSAIPSSTSRSSAACFAAGSRPAAKVGDLDAIVPSVAGQAWITGHNTIFLDDRDPFVKGFSVL